METQQIEIIMSLIAKSGDAKSSMVEAIHFAKDGHLEKAKSKLKEAENGLSKAHNVQTSLLTKEASGEKLETSLLMIHAQDHLMNAITFGDMAKEMIDLYSKFKE